METKHTPGPWKVVGHPILKNRNIRHAYRYVMTKNSEIELSSSADAWEGRNKSDWDIPWWLTRGSIICEMRDTEKQVQDAALIAAAPEMYEALKALIKHCDEITRVQYACNTMTHIAQVPTSIKAEGAIYDSARAALANAEGRG